MKTTKRLLLTAIVLMLILVMSAGCGGGNDNAPTYDNTPQTTNPQANNQAAANSSEGTQPGNAPMRNNEPGADAPMTPETTPMSSVPLQALINASSFLNGVAWVQGDDRLWSAIDRQGHVLFTLTEGFEPISHFYNGAALVNSGGTRELINTAGDVVSSPASGDYNEIMRIVPSNGMIIVYRHVNTFELTEHQYGIINSDGSWHMEMRFCSFLERFRLGAGSPTHATARPGGVWRSVDLTRWDVLAPYIGGGFLMLDQPAQSRGDDRVHRLIYNLYTGEVFDPDDRMRYDPEHLLWGSPGTDFILLPYTSGGDTALFTARTRSFGWEFGLYTLSSGEVLTEIMPVASAPGIHASNVTIRNLSDGLFYFSDMRQDRYVGGAPRQSNERQQGFFDIYGNKVIDLTEFGTRITVRDDFLDGYAFISVANEQGSTFFTFIDRNGNFTFNPIPDNPSIRNIGEGRFTMETNVDTVVMDMSMNELFNLGRSGVISSFIEGAAWIRYQDDIFFVDANMNRLFN